MEKIDQIPSDNHHQNGESQNNTNNILNYKLQQTNNTNRTNRFKKTKGRVKIKMEFIENKIRRYTTFSKRKTGIMKKAYELSTLTGTQVMLLVASETGHVYTFATEKLQPMITSEVGKNLIQSCLSTCNDDENSAGISDNKICIENFTNEADFDDDDDEDDEFYENDNDEINDSQEEMVQVTKNVNKTSTEDHELKNTKEKSKRKSTRSKNDKQEQPKSNKKAKISSIFNEQAQFSIPPSINQILNTHHQLQQMQQHHQQQQQHKQLQPMTVNPSQIIDNSTIARTIQFSSNSIK
ncbi:unnamed protein product [Brachionus calyciflorus]|uniref:MADS-box domain-containing protein n=1 Tax=Brachionus calyciflorus TaxID=104777 RepID=A0A813R7L7_9BILA|nr:unnamed protein product [Brachionus calyciflorus]